MVHIPSDVMARFLTQATLIKVAMGKQHGLNAFQFLALVLVGGTEWLSLKDLKASLSVPGSTLTFTVDSLEKKGLVKRRQGKEDRRQWFLSLSPKGRRLYQRVLKAETDAVLPLFEGFSEPEKAAFLKLAEGMSRVSAST